MAAYYGYGPPDLQSLADLVGRTGCIDVGDSRLALVLRNAEVARGQDADLVAAACREARLPTFTTPDGARHRGRSASIAGALDVKQSFDLFDSREVRRERSRHDARHLR